MQNKVKTTLLLLLLLHLRAELLHWWTRTISRVFLVMTEIYPTEIETLNPLHL